MSTTDLNFLINDFVDRLPEVSHAVAVSADGLLVARNRDLPRDQGEQAAAACSGLVSLLRGVGGVFAAGVMQSNMVMYEHGFMCVVAISDGASLLALATRHADTGLVSHELALLIGRAGPMLTPAARALPPLVDQQQPAPGGPAMRGVARGQAPR